jgi:PAS domain S-box-containing protein
MTSKEWLPVTGTAAEARGDELPIVEELYRLTDRLYRAKTPNDVYEAGLNAITSALGCTRASVLLLDDTGIMRFVAWRGLSDAYRHTVEGDSPWPRDIKDPRPVCIHDVHAADFAETLKATIKSEQIGALAFFPIVSNGAVIGKLTSYYDACHAFHETELELALTIARQLGFILGRNYAEKALSETEARLESELVAAQQLQQISSQLILASDVEVLYQEILDAAVAVMRSDFASMQMFHPERGELELLAHRGFEPSSVAFWQWVRPGAGCICGAALRSGERAIVSDVECCDFMAGTEDLVAYRQAGMRAMQSTPLFSRTGRLLGMISTHWRKLHHPSERDLRFLDVLARQAADLIERREAELTHQRLAAIVDTSHDGIVSKDLNGLITTWNRGAERLFGYTSDEMIGCPITTLIPLDRHHEEVRILEDIRRGEHVDHYETVRQRRDGTLIDVSITVSPLRNAAGEVVGASKIARDISERKKAEVALAERNLQLALAGRAALVGSYVYDVSRGTMQVSQGYATIHGLPEGTTETTLSEWRARVHPEDLARAVGLRDQAFADRQEEDNAEYRIILSTGKVRWIERRGSISYGEDGRPERVVGVNIDITERKQAEEHRNFLNAELDHRVKNVLSIVGAIITQSQHASASTADFVASINHRIKSLASTHEMLSHSCWQGASLEEIVRNELAPYTTANADIGGPSIVLEPGAAQATAMVLHELATNAAKYGALSNHGGRVSVRWLWLTNGTPHQRLAIEWQETGGPPVIPPSTSGYGTSVIRELIPFEFGGTVDLTFDPRGVRCRLEVPPQCVSRDRRVPGRSTPDSLGL